MTQDWMPGVERVAGAQAGGRMVGGPCKTTHHITTGGGFDFLTGYLVRMGFEPTLLADPVSGRVAQFLSAANSGYAMKHQGGPETNRQGDRHIQIEWCWNTMSDLTIDKAPKWAEVWARVLSFCRENGVPDRVPFGSINRPTSRDPGLWVEGGHACHFNAPGNDHSDGLPVSDTAVMFTTALPAPKPQEADVLYLIKTAGDPKVYVTDLITRRHVRNQADLGVLQRIGHGKAVDPNVYTLPDGSVAAIREVTP